MKIKTIVTTMLVVGTFGATAVAGPDYRGISESVQLEQYTNIKLALNHKNKFINVKKNVAQKEYFDGNVHEGKKRYIVRLIDASAASYSGGVKGLDAVNLSTKKSLLDNVAYNPKSSAAQKYVTYLNKQQDSFITQASSSLGHAIPKLSSYKYSINGLLTELTHVEAKKLAKMPQVAFIELDKKYQLNTDTGPVFIGAGEVWDGTAGGSEYMGEGTIIGMIDTGVNTDNRSFAATGDDGYTHTNPYGDGVYVGDCIADASLCNAKLIGVHSYSAVTDVYSNDFFAAEDQRPANGEDYNGHGSHTSSTAGGNVLLDVPLLQVDPASGTTGDGIATSLSFTRMSGVAPHANIISYQVCLPGDTGDTFAGCFGSATLSAIDDAITDGVDVINYSIGGTVPFNPWASATEIAFLNAQAAGIFVATSAGNSGPAASTTTKVSPWYTSVAASTHGRTIDLQVDFDGSSFLYAPSADGPRLAADVTSAMIYSGDVDAANFEGCNAFAAGSFTGSVAFISRGACSFTSKIDNAAAAGATSVIVFNNTDGDALVNMTTGATAIAAIFVSENSGNSMLASLTADPALQVTINIEATVAIGAGDDLASFSSRGPNSFAQIITPQIAAPGVTVYAAYSDDQPFKDVTGPGPADFAFLSGTSMASPHIAGSAALLTQVHPTWNPDQIRSALMMTSTTDMRKEDGVTAADFFDMGAGRVQVDQAINTGLVMSESQANYLAADPTSGGDPRTLNTPSMANFACGGSCSWTRTFTAINAGIYDFRTTETALKITPIAVQVEAGEIFSVVFTMDVATSSTGSETYTTVDITSTVSPDLHLPVYVKVQNGATPGKIDIKAGRNEGSYTVTSIASPPTDNLIVSLNGLFDASATGDFIVKDFDIPVDPTNGEFNDDLTQVFVEEFVVSPSSKTLNVSISAATSPDNDLYVEFDPNGDGGWTNISGFDGATGATNEQLSFDSPQAGKYRAIVQNFASANASDTGTLTIEVIAETDPLPGLRVDAPTSADGISPLDIKLFWDRDMAIGEAFFGDISVYAGEELIGNFPVTLERVANDVDISSSTTGPVARGGTIDYTIRVNRNLYKDDLDYTLTVDMPEGSKLLEGSVVANGGNFVVSDPNAEGLSIESDFDIAQDPTRDLATDDLSQVFVQEFDIPPATLNMRLAITASTSPDMDLFLEFDTTGNGTWSPIASSTTGTSAESIDVDSPQVGKWRAIVQNWQGSAAATDTGTLAISSTPAKGEGFIWTGTQSQAGDGFNVVSSLDSDVCANAGLSGWAFANGITTSLGYTPVSGFGIGTTGFAGDDAEFVAFADTVFPFYGESRQGMQVSSNGFVMFSGNAGVNSWLNLPIPNSAIPNDIIAGFWIDQILIDDGTRGVRVASLGGLKIIDFAGVQSWSSNGINDDRFSYQVQIHDSIIPEGEAGSFGPFEVIVAYSDTQVGSFTGATAGTENSTGSIGIDASSLIEPGVQLCFDTVQVGQEFEISFSVETTAESVGNPSTPKVLVQNDLAGTRDWVIDGAPVALTNVAPIANAGPDVVYNRGEISVGQITLDGSATSDLDRDQLLFTWTQTAGDEIPLHAPGTGRPFFNLSDVANGSYTFTVAVSDGEFSSTDEVTITIEGDSAASELNGSSFGSGGSIGGILLIIMGITFFNRRRLLK